MNGKTIHPQVSTAPRMVVDIPKREIEAFRKGWASGQIDMVARYWRMKDEPLSTEERNTLYKRIIRGYN